MRSQWIPSQWHQNLTNDISWGNNWGASFSVQLLEVLVSLEDGPRRKGLSLQASVWLIVLYKAPKRWLDKQIKRKM